MQSELKKILEIGFNTFPKNAGETGRFVFDQALNRKQQGLVDDEAAMNVEEKKENEAIKRKAESLKVQAANANLDGETKEVINRLLQKSVDPWNAEDFTALGYQNKVADLLSKDVTPEAAATFRGEVKKLEEEDDSWSTIFTIQRSVRKKIQDLQYRTESYTEIVKTPKGKTEFQALLKQVRKLNKDDDSVDRSLKRKLTELTTGTGPVLTDAASKQIYEVRPFSDDLKTVMAKHKGAIEGPGATGKANFRTLLALKKEESRIEFQMTRLCEELDAIINKNLSKVRLKTAKQKVLEDDSELIGITLKEGTEIEYNDPADPSMTGTRKTAKIKRITFDEHNIRDKNGKMVDKSLGIPHIHMENGADLTLGRFKKWVDATDATEKINSVEEIERATGMAAYGIKLEEGMMLSYPRRHRATDASPVETTMMHVTVKEINGATRRIRFDQPVLFNPGFPTGTDYDFRESLTFGEFVKWKHRYEVEKSVSLDEVRKLLIKHNELENKFYGIEAKDNLPIRLDKVESKFEELEYPDEVGSKYLIIDQDAESVTVDAFGKMSFSEFFYWVKNNHVRRVDKKKSSAVINSDKEKKLEKETVDTHEKDIIKTKERAGEEQQERAIADAERRAAGSVIETMKDVWFTTTFLSMKDLWNMGKEVLEFMKRKHERRSKGRYSQVGSRLPWVLGTEFERVKQAAENEEAGKYKEAMEHWSIEKVKTTLHRTTSKDEAKACLQVLVHKGEVRWDDHEMWDTLNKLTARYTLRGAELFIPKPENMPQGKSGENMALKALDALYGEGTGNEWFMDNTSKYNSIKNNFEYEFKQLENDPKGTGGPAGELFNMLTAWREGEYVNPQKYEAMLDGAIKFGKMNAEQKMFYIIAGVITRQGDDPLNGRHNPHGETLLHIDRVAELNSKYCPQFPMLDYFTQEEVPDYSLIDPKTGKYGKMRKFNFSDYEKWAHMYFWKEYEKGKPGAQFSAFMWEKALLADSTRTRISKGIRNAEGMDHDDMHLYGPPLSLTEIDSLLAPQSGNKKYLTNEGYMNVYQGYNQYIVSLSYTIENATDDAERQKRMATLKDLINGFVIFDATLDGRRFKDKGSGVARLDNSHYEKGTVVDGACPLRVHQLQLQNLVVKIGRAYGQDWDQWLYKKKTGSMLDDKEKQKQQAYERKLDGLKTLIPELLEQDNGEKAMAVIKEMRTKGELDTHKGGSIDVDALRGSPSSRRPPMGEYREMLRKGREWELEHMRKGGHGGGH